MLLPMVTEAHGVGGGAEFGEEGERRGRIHRHALIRLDIHLRRIHTLPEAALHLHSPGPLLRILLPLYKCLSNTLDCRQVFQIIADLPLRNLPLGHDRRYQTGSIFQGAGTNELVVRLRGVVHYCVGDIPHILLKPLNHLLICHGCVWGRFLLYLRERHILTILIQKMGAQDVPVIDGGGVDAEHVLEGHQVNRWRAHPRAPRLHQIQIISETVSDSRNDNPSTRHPRIRLPLNSLDTLIQQNIGICVVQVGRILLILQ